jgi:hypothetical protein
MSDTGACGSCGSVLPAADLRRVPRRQGDGVVEALVCVPCVPRLFDDIRALLADDDGSDYSDAVMAGVVVAVWFRTRGVADAAIQKERPLRDILVAVRELLDEMQANDGRLGRRALCSGCMGVTAERAIAVVPAWNDSAGDYVTSFRCPACLATTIDGVRARLADPARTGELERLCELFKRHAIFVHEYLRGDPIEQVRPIVLHLLDLIASRALVIPIGDTVPLARG